jgi:hypothetical protein
MGFIFFIYIRLVRGMIFVLNIDATVRFYLVSYPVLDTRVQE